METRKHIRYHELLEILGEVDEIAQIFTLNNKMFLQIEEDVRMFGNKNISDSERLFELLREDLLKKKRKGNFIFVKDVTTNQRKNLYIILKKKGYDSQTLFRHYSY